MKTVPLEVSRKFSVAPMMDVTDRHFRRFLRLLSRKSLLYSEMISTRSLIHADPQRFLRFSHEEKPVVLQLGGCDPKEFEICAKLSDEFGYDEINLNIGCPAKNAAHGNFGVILFKEPELVAECISAIRSVTETPVSIKTRIGVDDVDQPENLRAFIEKTGKAGCRFFTIHARKALLNGINPKQNRSIPRIDYERAIQIGSEFPEYHFTINGEIKTIRQCRDFLKIFGGVMVGREIAENPFFLARIDREIFDEKIQEPSISNVLAEYAEYAIACLHEGVPPRILSDKLYGLKKGEKGAKQWRIHTKNPPKDRTRAIEFFQQLPQFFAECGKKVA